MTIVVLEHLTSAPRRRGRAALEREGRAMRDAIAADLRGLRGVTVRVLDRRDIPRGASRDGVFRRMLRRADAALVIAPEEDGILERLARTVEAAGRALIGPGPAAIRLAADKAATARVLNAAGIPVPETAVVRFAAAASALARRRPPCVLKPRDGCGGAGVVEVRGPRGVAAAVAIVRRATLRSDFLWQERVDGIDASVAVLAAAPGTPGRFLAIGPCRQRIRRGRPFAYEGGEAPLAHARAAEALDSARRAVAALDLAAGGAARGWLGVDLVIGEGGVRVIEINPRLTTSYIGLRHVVHPALAGLMVAAARGGRLPERVAIRGRCRFGADGRVVTGWRRPTAAGTSAASI